MTLTGIVIAGTVGSWFGATVMYWGARLIGRPLLMKYGRYVLLPQQKIEAAEAWSDRFGAPGVFISRLLPVIRHLIGLPAGIVRMHYGWYSLATLVGSAIWSAVLCWIGVTAGQDEALMQGSLSRITYVAGRRRRGAGRDVLLLRTSAHAPPIDLNERFNRTGSNAPPASVDALPVRASPECRRAPDRRARSRDTTVPVVRLIDQRCLRDRAHQNLQQFRVEHGFFEGEMAGASLNRPHRPFEARRKSTGLDSHHAAALSDTLISRDLSGQTPCDAHPPDSRWSN